MRKILMVLTLLFTSSILTSVNATIVDWKLLTGNAAFGGRSFINGVTHTSKVWVIGGIGDVWKNDVWYSTNGADWTAATGNAAFSARYLNNNVSFNGVLYSGFGDGNPLLNDFYSSTNGSDWTCLTKNAINSGRADPIMLVFNNKMWVIGGQSATSTFPNDVWYSTNGADWTAATLNAEFTGRYISAGVVFDNKMWIIAGYGAGTPHTDVWYSSDGVLWTEATSNAPFGNQYGGGVAILIEHKAVVLDGKIWVIGGNDGGTTWYNDVWYSANGVDWTKDSTGQFPDRGSFGLATMNNKLIIFGGRNTSGFLKDVWLGSISTPAATSTAIIASATRTPLATYTSTRTATLTRTVSPTNTVPTSTRTITPYFTFTGTYTRSATFTPTGTITLTKTTVPTASQSATFTPTATATLTAGPSETATTFPTPFLSYIRTDKESNGATIWITWPQYDTYARYAIAYGDALQHLIWVNNDHNTTSDTNRFIYPLSGNIPYNTDVLVRVTVYTDNPLSILVSNTITVNLGTEGQYDLNLFKINGTPIPTRSPGILPVEVVGIPTTFPVLVTNLTPQFTQVPTNVAIEAQATFMVAVATRVGVISGNIANSYTAQQAQATQQVAQVPSPQFTQIPLATPNTPVVAGIIAQATQIALIQAVATQIVFQDGSISTMSKEYFTGVAEGDIPGHGPFTKDSRNMAIGATEEFMWANNTSFTWLPDEPGQLKVVSDSTSDSINSTGIQKVNINYLNGDFIQLTVIIDTYGTGPSYTPVTDIVRVNNFRAYQIGNNKTSVGNISLNSVSAGTLASIIPAGMTRARNSAYTVPAGKTLYITDIEFSGALGGSAGTGDYIYPALKANMDNIRFVKTNYFNTLWEAIYSGGDIEKRFTMPIKLIEKVDMGVWVLATKGTGVASIRLSGWLEDM